MANFSMTIDNKYSVDSVENTKKTYKWIHDSIERAALINSEIESNFLFKVGGITCNCDSYEEFIENAYGTTDYILIQITLSQWDAKKNTIIVVKAESSGIRVTANNKVVLEKILHELKSKSKPRGNTYIDTQYNIGDVSGSNVNINQGKHNKIITSNKKDSKIKIWLESILQNILANWLWIVITAVVGFIFGICI